MATESSFCFPNLSLPSSVTKYVSPKFIANCALLSIKIMCIKNTIPGFIINGFPVKIIGGTSILHNQARDDIGMKKTDLGSITRIIVNIIIHAISKI